MKTLFQLTKPYLILLLAIIAIVVVISKVIGYSDDSSIKKSFSKIQTINLKVYTDSLERENRLEIKQKLDSQYQNLNSINVRLYKEVLSKSRELDEVIKSNRDTNCIPIIVSASQYREKAVKTIDTLRFTLKNREELIKEDSFIIENLTLSLEDAKKINRESTNIINKLSKKKLNIYGSIGISTMKYGYIGGKMIYGNQGIEINYLSDLKSSAYSAGYIIKF